MIYSFVESSKDDPGKSCLEKVEEENACSVDKITFIADQIFLQG